jgi:hypothetical protein
MIRALAIAALPSIPSFGQLAQPSARYDLVIANGVAVVSNGERTGAKPGQLVRGAGHTTTVSH